MSRSLQFAFLAVTVALPCLASSPPVPSTPSPALELLAVRFFSVEEPFVFTWRAERPAVREGTMVVVRVDPALIRPRQTAEPVLYVGGHTAWRVSPYNEAGRVVAFVPARVDLAREPVWFGSPRLPERVDGAVIAAERELARAAGIRPFGETVVDGALRGGGGEVVYRDRTALLQALHEWVVERIAP